MVSAASICCQNRLSLCDWCLNFNSDSPVTARVKTITLAELVAKRNLAYDVIRLFMRDIKEPENCSYRTRFLAQFCTGASLELPVKQDSKCASRPVAIVNDYTYDEHAGTFQPHQSALDAEHLYEYLSKPKAGKETQDTFAQDEKKGKRSDFQVHQLLPEEKCFPKLIFVADLDSTTTLAIMSTATQERAWALRYSIYNCLARKPAIQVTIARVPLPTFRLAIDLPFNALRECAPLRHNATRWADGKGLRTRKDISFLAANPSNARTRYHLYKVHFSGLIWGTGNSEWEAYGFGDTYFDDDESIEDYLYDPDAAEQTHEDPLRRGEAADKPVKDPRHYFLAVLLAWIKRIKVEWRHLLDNVEELMKDSELYFRGKFLRNASLTLPYMTNTVDHLSLFEAVHDWINHTDDLLVTLEEELSALTREWDTINSHVNSRMKMYFGYMEISAQYTLQEIQVEFEDLASFVQNVKAMQQRCKRIESENDRYFASLAKKSKAESIATATEMKELTLAQVQTGEHVKKMGSVMTMLAIFSLATQIYAIPKDNNLIAVHPGSAFALLAALVAIAASLHIILRYQSRCIELMKGKMGVLAVRVTRLVSMDRAPDLPA